MEETQISEYKILQSSAGYYVGTLYFDEECGAWLPYARLSAEYWSTLQEAQEALDNGRYTSKTNV